jgi:hypothetical protein
VPCFVIGDVISCACGDSSVAYDEFWRTRVPPSRSSVWPGASTGTPRAPNRLVRRKKGGSAVGLIIALLVLWLAFAIVGFVIKSLFWLAILGIVLFVATGVFGAMRRRSTLR